MKASQAQRRNVMNVQSMHDWTSLKVGQTGKREVRAKHLNLGKSLPNLADNAAQVGEDYSPPTKCNKSAKAAQFKLTKAARRKQHDKAARQSTTKQDDECNKSSTTRAAQRMKQSSMVKAGRRIRATNAAQQK
jgi:hypothetical protein